MEHSRSFVFASWALRAIAAIILLQTLFFKFTGAKESVYIFTTVGMEPWGRIGSGVVPAVDDHGELFALAVTVFVCSLAVLAMHRRELPLIGRSL